MKKLNNNKAFTLIELLVVIAIIGILSTVVLVNLSGTRQRARDARRKSDLANIRLAIEMFYDANDSMYPAAAADWDTFITTGDGAAVGALMSGGKMPIEPLGSSIHYCYADDGDEAYKICAWMEGTGAVECLPSATVEGLEGECTAKTTDFGYPS